MTTYHHADIVPCSVATLLDGLIDDDIHERIETAQNTNNCSAAVQLQHHSLVHEPGNEHKQKQFSIKHKVFDRKR